MSKLKSGLLLILLLIIISLGYFLILKKTKTAKPVLPKLQKVSLMMPFIPQIQWAAYYTAKYNNYYQDEGLDVDMQYSNQGSTGAIEQLVGGNTDIILATEDTVIIAKAKGLDIIAVYPIEPTNIFYVISAKSENITKAGDLIHKKIGVASTATAAYTNLLIILNSAKIKTDQVDIILAGTAIIPSFLEKKVDAVAVHLSQKVVIEDKMPEVNVINAADYSNMSSNHITTTKKLINNNPDLIKKFVRATKKGLEYAVNNSDKAVDIYISFNPDAQKDRKVNLDLWKAIIKAHNYQEKLPGSESKEDWQKTQNFLLQTKLIDKETDVSQMFTNDFIPQ